MKTFFSALSAFLMLTSASAASPTEDVFRPYRISMKDLMMMQTNGKEGNHQALSEALSTIGMISITDIGDDFTSMKDQILGSLHGCAVSSAATQEHVYGDGTRRRTMATHCDHGRSSKLQHGAGATTCEAFDKVSEQFRNEVGRVTQVFAQKLESILGAEFSSSSSVDISSNNKNNLMNEPLLSTPNGMAYHTVNEIVRDGEHLEHFHSYEKTSDTDPQDTDETIEWHTDQGLFLVFTPGVLVNTATSTPSGLSEGFYIKFVDDSTATVQFDKEDELVIMLGDGVNQYVNPRRNTYLHATPHALSLPTQTKEEARVWYGRMVLPPAEALYPNHGSTFGELRRLMINRDEQALSLACSHSQYAARQLEDTACEAGSLWCWHRCMNLTDYGLNETTCATQDLDLACINPARELWNGEHASKDEGYGPGCVDLETAVVAEPAASTNGNETATTDSNTTDHTTAENGDTHEDHEGDDHSGQDHSAEGVESTSAAVVSSAKLVSVFVASMGVAVFF
jgi:hypothetical protein